MSSEPRTGLLKMSIVSFAMISIESDYAEVFGA
jgi:hypothetical protein